MAYSVSVFIPIVTSFDGIPHERNICELSNIFFLSFSDCSYLRGVGVLLLFALPLKYERNPNDSVFSFPSITLVLSLNY